MTNNQLNNVEESETKVQQEIKSSDDQVQIEKANISNQDQVHLPEYVDVKKEPMELPEPDETLDNKQGLGTIRDSIEVKTEPIEIPEQSYELFCLEDRMKQLMHSLKTFQN